MGPKLLVLGRTGQVGYELVRSLVCLGEVEALGREQADFSRPDTLAALVEARRPALVFNATAYTAVDRAEMEADEARVVNADAPAILAAACARVGARLVHYSTDYVFDGTARTPYGESALTAPLGVYGRTKLAGERAVLHADPRHLVLRLAWVYGTRGRNFMLTMRRLAREGRALRVVDDQVGSPSWSRTIAEASAHAARQILAEPDAPGGLYHLTSQGDTTWCGFAREIVRLDMGEAAPEVMGIATADYPTAAERPAYSVLSSTRFRARFGVGLPHWRDQLALALEDLK
jgi:dTDP-4-dehydrorhamnose reductase